MQRHECGEALGRLKGVKPQGWPDGGEQGQVTEYEEEMGQDWICRRTRGGV